MESLVRAKHHLPEQLLWQYQDIGLLRQARLVKSRPLFAKLVNSISSEGSLAQFFVLTFFDDGTLSEQQFKKLKAFTDVGNVESMSKER